MTKVKTRMQKGKDLEDLIALKIRESGLDPRAERSKGSGSGNREKADISTSLQIFGRNIGIEAKNQETLHIPEWWRQTEKLELVGREPVLIFKLPKRNPRLVLVTITLDTFLEMMVGLQGADNVNSNLIETQSYDKTNHYNSLEFAIRQLQGIKNDYKKKILNKEDE